ncbi:MAG TPA: cytochrome c-type biogenesis CcmF C-terminal domain-containing protein [Nannocystaceae bacterium]|nr:cytochrome c-type biogenesis CcmF C-terminal domain-containing protein [Nannocystaceae bacterium]
MPISTLGSIANLVLFLLAVVTVALAVIGASRRSERLVEGAVQGIHGIFGIALFTSMLLEYAFLSGDTSIQYVQQNSHPAMPVIFKITAFWGSLDGSLLFWVLLLSLFASLAVRANRTRHRALIPHAVAILATILAFFTALLVFLNNPFEPWIFPELAPTEGKGLNPLLQNPYMVCHPPSLYLGMVSLAVPYAFGMAAMITGHVDDAWQRSVRRWTLFSWLFLSVGLVLGGLWAYEELGWGGYWAWDPVENAGLLPWLTCTAFLHSIMVQERRGMLKVWNLVLVIVSFFLTIFGTFLTRSGVVQSVHAFGEDPQLAWTFGAFMLLIVVGSFGLLVWRLPLLRSRHELESVVSREFAFLLNNWMFLICALFVAGATMYPTLTQWAGDLMKEHEWFRGLMGAFGVHEPPTRVTVGPAFFNHYMAPLGVALLFLTGFGPLVAWRKTSTQSLVEQFRAPLAAGVVATLIAAFGIPLLRNFAVGERLDMPQGGWELMSGWGLAAFGLCGFTFWTITQEFYRGVAVRRRARQQSVLDALIGLVSRARRRYGGYIVHLGVVLMFLGWAGNSYKIERKLGIYPGETTELGDYTIEYIGARATQDWQKDMITVELNVTKNGGKVGDLTPAKWWYYQLPDQPTTEVSRIMRPGGDVYSSIADVDMSSGWCRLSLYYNPLVNWVWVGFAILLAGGIVCIGAKREEAEGGGP